MRICTSFLINPSPQTIDRILQTLQRECNAYESDVVKIEHIPRNWVVSDVRRAVLILCRGEQISIHSCKIGISSDASRGNYALVQVGSVSQAAAVVWKIRGYKDSSLELPLFAYMVAPAR